MIELGFNQFLGMDSKELLLGNGLVIVRNANINISDFDIEYTTDDLVESGIYFRQEEDFKGGRKLEIIKS